MHYFKKFIHFAIKIIILFIAAYTLLNSIFNSVVIVQNGLRFNSSYIHIDSIILTFLILYCFRFFNKLTTRSKKVMNYLLLLIVITTIFITTKLSFYNSNDDAMLCIDIASSFANSIKTHTPLVLTDYLERTPHQIGLVIFETILMLISNNHFNTIFYILNLISLLGVYIYLSKLINIFYPEKDCFLPLLCVLWIVPLIYTKFYYGWHIGLFFATLSIYYFVKYQHHNDIKYFLISILTLLISAFLKPNFSIIFIAYILIIIFTINKKNLLLSVLAALSLLVSINLSPVVVKLLFPYSNKSSVPMTGWLVMGNQTSSWGNGWFNGYVNSVFSDCNGESNCMSQIINNDLNEIIINVIDNPIATTKFYLEKANDLLLIKDFQMHSYYVMGASEHNTNELLIKSPYLEISYLINEISYTFLLIGIVVYEIVTIKNKQFQYTVIELSYLGGFTYHLLFEAKGIYMFPWFTLLLPLSAIGLKKLSISQECNKINKSHRYYIGLSLIFILIALFYNPKDYEKISFENYSNTLNSVQLIHGNYIEQPFIVNEPLTISSIEFMTNGYIPTTATIGLELYQNNILIHQQYFNTQVFTDYGWAKLPLENPIQLCTGTYRFKLFSDNKDPNLSIIVGIPSTENAPGYILNSINNEETLNFKLLSSYKQIENEKFIFDKHYSNQKY